MGRSSLWLVGDLCSNRIDHRRGSLDLLADTASEVAEAAFHIRFSDRALLVSFQEILAQEIAKLDFGEHSSVFSKPDVLERPKHIPAWLKKAVFLRDKGRCTDCFADLTGLIAIDPKNSPRPYGSSRGIRLE